MPHHVESGERRFLAAVSRIDLTDRDVLVKSCVHCMDGGRGRRFREDLQASNVFSMFNKHVAAELIKPEVKARGFGDKHGSCT